MHNISLKGAEKILVNITTVSEVMLGEMSDAARIIKNSAEHQAQVVWAHVIDEDFDDEFRASLMALYF